MGQLGKDDKFYQTKDFKKLNAKWKKKLEQSGFEDIEQPEEYESGVPDGNLKQWSSTFFISPSRFDKAKYDSKEEYYRLAGQFLHDHKFGSKDEKKLWEMHSDGLSIETIVKIFRASGTNYLLGRKINNRFTHETIRRLFGIMTGKLKDE